MHLLQLILDNIEKSLHYLCNGLSISWLHTTVSDVIRDSCFIRIHKAGEFQVPEEKSNSQQQLLELVFFDWYLVG